MEINFSRYAVYHGPAGLRNIAQRIHHSTVVLAKGLEANGNVLRNGRYFDTLKIKPSLPIEDIKARAEAKEINFRYFADGDVKQNYLNLPHFNLLYKLDDFLGGHCYRRNSSRIRY